MKKKTETKPETVKQAKKKTERKEQASRVPLRETVIGFLRPANTYTPLIFIVAILICFSLSAGVRLKQYSVWTDNPATHFVNKIPMMTTLDSYHWFKHAKEYQAGTHSAEEPVQLLSLLIAKLSVFFGGDIYKTGIYLIPVIASLFVIPLCLYFFNLGLPAAGIIGGLVGTFSFMYMARSCIGRVDTDALNLFFPFLASYFILLAGAQKTLRNICLFSMSAGFSMLIFDWWYAHPGFTVVYLLVLIVYLFLNKTEKKTILIASAAFVLCSNPAATWRGIETGKDLMKIYFTIKESTGLNSSIAFPNILQTITETQHVQAKEILSNILTQPDLTVTGLLLFGICAIVYWKKIFPIMPVFALGLMAFKSSNRFAMFLGPFIGIGFGYLLNILLSFLFDWIKKKEGRNLPRELSVYAASFLFFFIISGQTAISFVPMPSIPANIYSTFIDFKNRSPQNSALVTWWDYGHALSDAGFKVYHDGAMHGGPPTFFTAKGLVSDNQNELHNIIRCLGSIDDKCFKSVDNIVNSSNGTYAEMMNTALTYKGAVADENIFVLFTADMIGKYGVLNYFGKWDFEAKSGKYDGLEEIRCVGMTNDILNCGELNIDLKYGLINGKTPLKKTVFSRNGSVSQEITYRHGDGFYLELLTDSKNNVLGSWILNDSVFSSNFNQMFLLGRYDKTLFEEAYNAFPAARYFKVKALK